LAQRLGEHAAMALSAIHPILVRERVRRDGGSPFTEVVHVARDVTVPRVVITAGYRETVQLVLGDDANLFDLILGREDGDKDALLASWAGSTTLLVTDTVRDLQAARALGMRAAAVGWGYDSTQALVAYGVEWMIDSPSALRGLLDSLGLLAPPDPDQKS
jgi:phosphoglycolate phosphatase-like HAD superfamily hydrolase